MTKNIILLLTLTLIILTASGRQDATYLKANAILINNPENLRDSVYTVLKPFQIIMFGEMHGTNESAPFVSGLTKLFTSKGDSVQVGLEITPELMNKFLRFHTDSSIYQSEFFGNPPYFDGKESYSWANLISSLNKNPKVKIFFFDTNRDKEVVPLRDSLMYVNIKTQFKQNPAWKLITLSGNFHNNTSNQVSMISFLMRDKELKLSTKICSLNMEYKEGSCNANFTHGLEIKRLGSYPSVYNSTEGYDQYLVLLDAKSNYEYTGFYYTKYITPAKMVSAK